MNNEILVRLNSKVVKRMEFDTSNIENRFMKPKKDKSKKSKSQKNTSSMSDEEREYLIDVYEDEDIPLTARAERLGITSTNGAKIKNELLRKNLVIEYEVKVGGLKKFLKITHKGCKYLKVAPPKQEGKGSHAHRFCQRAVFNHFRDFLGLKAKIEGSKKGKCADVAVIEENGKSLAIEVALTPKNEMRNIKEDLKVGFDRVLVVCRNPMVKREVENRMKEALTDEEKVRVETCLLTQFL
jgi:DNA-binding MarR family transcriptional regulator